MSGTREASAPSDGIDNNFCNAAMARSGSPSCAATLARISRIFATPSCFAISGRFSGALLKRCVDVREITFRSAILERRVRISS